MYINIFNEVHRIMQSDYAGYVEKEVNAESYLKQLHDLQDAGEMDDAIFSNLVNTYLLNYNDNHVYFLIDNKYEFTPKDCGFNVKRFENSLYITEIYNDNLDLLVGMEIVEIDDQHIEWAAKENLQLLREEINERQQWRGVLNKATTITVKTFDNQLKNIPLKKYSNHYQSRYELKVLEENIVYLKFPHFEHTTELDSVINQAIELMQTNNQLILDLRDNPGGNGNFFNPLLPYFFNSNEKPSTKIKPRLFNCTHNNVEAFLQLINEVKPQITDPNTIAMLDLAETQFQENKGKGFININFNDHVQHIYNEFKGNDLVKDIIILTNSKTASAAEEVVETCRQSSKVTTIGQATLGINDYSDLVLKKWGEKFTLYYPISKVEDFTPYDPIHGKGIQPDIYIPFHPSNIHKDVELELAVERLTKLNV